MNGITIIHFEAYPFQEGDRHDQSSYDIVLESSSNLENTPPLKFRYCHALLNKLLELEMTELEEFLQYQIDQLKNPLSWLGSFLQLVQLNEAFFLKHNQEPKRETLIKSGIQFRTQTTKQLRQQLQELSTVFYQMQYNIESIQQQVDQLPTYMEKVSFLLHVRAAYLRENPKDIPHAVIPFDQQLELEIERLTKLNELKAHLNVNQGSSSKKLQFNMSVPEMAFFFRLLHHSDLIQVTNKSELYRLIAQTCGSKRAPNISWKSLKNHFEEPSKKVRDIWVQRMASCTVEITENQEF